MSSPTTLSPHAGIGAFGHYPHSDLAFLDRRAVEGMTTSASAASIESLLVNSGQGYYPMEHSSGHNAQYVQGANFDQYQDSYRRRVPANDIFVAGQEAAKRASVDGAPYHAEQYIAPRDLGVAPAPPSYYQSFPTPQTATYSPRSSPAAAQGSPQYGQTSSWGHAATTQEEIQRGVNYYPQIQPSQTSNEAYRLSDPSWSYAAGTYGNSHTIPAIDGHVARGLPPASGMNYSTIPAHSGPQVGSPPAQYATSRQGGVTQGEEPARSKPQCWQHGCNGRQFSTFSNLLRHQRERAGTAAKSTCPRCGAEFTRTTARNGHVAHAKCRPRRSPESS